MYYLSLFGTLTFTKKNHKFEVRFAFISQPRAKQSFLMMLLAFSWVGKVDTFCLDWRITGTKQNKSTTQIYEFDPYLRIRYQIHIYGWNQSNFFF